MKRNYIGLTGTCQDSAIAIVADDGTLLFAESLDRVSQNRRASNMIPDDVMLVDGWVEKYCQPDAHLVVATSWSRSLSSRWALLSRLLEVAYRPTTWAGRARKAELFSHWRGLANIDGIAGLNLELRMRQRGALREERLQRKRYEHDLAHAAAAAYASPFTEAVCVVVDAYGERSSVSVFQYRGGRLDRVPSVKPRGRGSLAKFYAMVGEACGFDSTAGEHWTSMDLAARDTFDRQLYERLRRLLRVDRCQIAMRGGWHDVLSRMTDGDASPAGSSARAGDLAHVGQKVFVEVYLELLRQVDKLGISKNLILTGECALNDAANRLVLKETNFERLYVPAAPADDGTCIGAAWLAYQDDHPEADPGAFRHTPYVGSSLSAQAVDRLKRFSGLPFEDLAPAALHGHVADQVAAGKVVGWIQGRAEIGWQALGNRSIVADPRTAGALREVKGGLSSSQSGPPWMLAILEDRGADYFDHFQSSPFFDRAFSPKPERYPLLSRAARSDGLVRVQTVSRELNPSFYDLIDAFHRLTGVPFLLAAGLKLEGKPLVHSVEDAIAVLLTTGVDQLVIGSTVFGKVALQHDMRSFRPAPASAPQTLTAIFK